MTNEPAPYRRLTRATNDRRIGGVCAGIANYFHVDPTLVRVITLVLALFTAGWAALLYLILWVIIPAER